MNMLIQNQFCFIIDYLCSVMLISRPGPFFEELPASRGEGRPSSWPEQ